MPHAAIAIFESHVELFYTLPTLQACMDYLIAERIVGGACVTLGLLQTYAGG